MGEEFDRLYEELKELNEQYFKGECENVEERLEYLTQKAFKLQYLIDQERTDRLNMEISISERIENLTRGIGEMQDSLFEIIDSQEEINHILGR